jgi:hypothetical protein
MKFRTEVHFRRIVAVFVVAIATDCDIVYGDSPLPDGLKPAQSPSLKKEEVSEKQAEDAAQVDDSKAKKASARLSKSEQKKQREAWVKRYQGAVRKLKTAPADEVAKIEEMILTTREAEALGPMVEVLGRESAPIRLLLDRSLAGNESEMAWIALGERLLIEPDPEVRRGILKLIEKESDSGRSNRLLTHVKTAIADKNPVRAGLGAQAAADLGWRQMVPSLIDQLMPVRVVRGISWEPEPVSSGGAGLSVGSVDGYVLVPVPVVGPGVVAYGQQIIPYGSGLSFGSPGGSVPKLKPVMRAGPQAFPNPAVQQALVELSGVDFGYDMMLWRNWLKQSFRLDDQPRKRVLVP